MGFKYGFRKKPKYAYVVEFCTDIPVCGVALFRANAFRDHRGKFYSSSDYVCSKKGNRDTVSCELFVSDVPKPYTFKAESDDKARKKFLRYVKKIENAFECLEKWSCGF